MSPLLIPSIYIAALLLVSGFAIIYRIQTKNRYKVTATIRAVPSTGQSCCQHDNVESMVIHAFAPGECGDIPKSIFDTLPPGTWAECPEPMTALEVVAPDSKSDQSGSTLGVNVEYTNGESESPIEAFCEYCTGYTDSSTSGEGA